MEKHFCKICSKESFFLFEGLVMNKYMAKYFKCSKCNTIHIDSPNWLNEAYSSAITALDLGLLSRCILNVSRTESLINQLNSLFNYKTYISILDFAGGYGVYTRLMRDNGFDCYWQDDYCENVFAKDFIHNDNAKYDIVTAFEVFEHEQDPNLLFKRLTTLSDNILFSTLILPSQSLKETNDWWYFTPETGQHITFYTLTGLELLARKYGYNFYSNGSDLHFISKIKLRSNPFIEKSSNHITIIKRIFDLIIRSLYSSNKNKKRKSLLESDYLFVKNKINDKRL
jgi:hypothetical protein